MQKIAVLSDIHSNYWALEACLEDAKKRGAKSYVFLGDYVTDCAYPMRTVDRLMELSGQYPCVFIRGNREEYLLSGHRSGGGHWAYGNSHSGSLKYTYDNLTQQALAFFESMPDSREFRLSGSPPIALCHAKPDANRANPVPNSSEARQVLNALQSDLMLCGHTHKQFEFSLGGKTMVNPGSVGIQTDGTPAARYAMLTMQSGVWVPRLLSVAYDLERTVAELFECKLHELAPTWTRLIIAMLRTGFECGPLCIRLARELESKSTGQNSPDGIPEQYWCEAADRLCIEPL